MSSTVGSAMTTSAGLCGDVASGDQHSEIDFDEEHVERLAIELHPPDPHLRAGHLHCPIDQGGAESGCR